MQNAVIVSAVRTPLGSFGGTLSTLGATDLGGMVIKEAITRAGIESSRVDECIMGMVLPCGYGRTALGSGSHYREQGVRIISQGCDAGGPGHPVQ
jgi:acetyl-CoA acetyltransferase